jgi:Uncharacterized conserved protein
MKTYLEYRDEKSKKFWEIEVSGKSFTVCFGKIGAAGQSQTKEFITEQAAQHEAEKLITEKLRKGYREGSALENFQPGTAVGLEPKRTRLIINANEGDTCVFSLIDQNPENEIPDEYDAQSIGLKQLSIAIFTEWTTNSKEVSGMLGEVLRALNTEPGDWYWFDDTEEDWTYIYQSMAKDLEDPDMDTEYEEIMADIDLIMEDSGITMEWSGSVFDNFFKSIEIIDKLERGIKVKAVMTTSFWLEPFKPGMSYESEFTIRWP